LFSFLVSQLFKIFLDHDSAIALSLYQGSLKLGLTAATCLLLFYLLLVCEANPVHEVFPGGEFALKEGARAVGPEKGHLTLLQLLLPPVSEEDPAVFKEHFALTVSAAI
jgi:hypothetical protein